MELMAMGVLVAIYLIPHVVISYPVQPLPKYGEGWWSDDFIFNLQRSKDVDGWIYGGDDAIDDEVMINLDEEGANFKYHGDFYFREDIPSFSRDFECPFDEPSSVVVSYQVRYCHAKNAHSSGQTIAVEVNGNPLRPILSLDEYEGEFAYDNSDDMINKVCPKSKDIGQQTFNASTTPMIYHQDAFTVDFKLGFNHHINRMFIYNIKMACETAAQSAQIHEDLTLFDEAFEGDVEYHGQWVVYEDGKVAFNDNTPIVEYDGHMVSLSGAIQWTPADCNGDELAAEYKATRPMGHLTTCPDVVGKAPQGFIGKIIDEKAWPKYTSIFTVTNHFGIIASIEIKGAEARNGQKGKLYLKAWALPLVFYNTHDTQITVVKDTDSPLAIPIDDLTEIYDLTGYKWNNPDDEADNDVANLFTIHLDGITYIAQGAFLEGAGTVPAPGFVDGKNIYLVCALISVLSSVMTALILFFVYQTYAKYSKYSAFHQMKVVSYADTETE
eukprot:263495_1